MSDSPAGKGDKPRSCFSQVYRDNYDFVFGKPEWERKLDAEIAKENRAKKRKKKKVVKKMSGKVIMKRPKKTSVKRSKSTDLK